MFPVFTAQHDNGIVAEDRNCGNWTAKTRSFAPLNPASIKQQHFRRASSDAARFHLYKPSHMKMPASALEILGIIPRLHKVPAALELATIIEQCPYIPLDNRLFRSRCNAERGRLAQLIRHSQSAENTAETGECSWEFRSSGEKVQCGTCSKLYASKKSLKIHNRIHTGYKPYACPICPKRFTQTNVLKAHINYHTGRRDWLCKICNKAFTQSAHLRTHEKTHSQRKDYQCPFCQQNFSCKGVRDRHIRQHTGEKPYQCQLCEKRFTRGESLKFHENAHQGIRPYSCPQEHCRKTFTKQSSLKRHIRSTHTGVSSFKNRPAKFVCHLGRYSGCSAIFPTNMSSPTATSDCASVAGSSSGPDSPLTIKIEELDEDDTEDQVLENFISNLSVAELDRLNRYLGVNDTEIALDSILNPPNVPKAAEMKPMVPSSQQKDAGSFGGQFGMTMWDPADWDIPEQKVFERPGLPNLLDLSNFLDDAKFHFQQIAYNVANIQPSFSPLFSTSF